jgi:hypothetical protein
LSVLGCVANAVAGVAPVPPTAGGAFTPAGTVAGSEMTGIPRASRSGAVLPGATVPLPDVMLVVVLVDIVPV